MALDQNKYIDGAEFCELIKITPFQLCRFLETEPLIFDAVFFYPENPKDPHCLREEEVLTAKFPQKTINLFFKFYPEYAPQALPDNGTESDELPPYLDPSTKFYSEELHIAIKTWLAIYHSPGGIDPDQPPRQQIIKHLFMNYPELFPDSMTSKSLTKYWRAENPEKPKTFKKLPSKVNRIVTMINYDKGGGAPKTK